MNTNRLEQFIWLNFFYTPSRLLIHVTHVRVSVERCILVNHASCWCNLSHVDVRDWQNIRPEIINHSRQFFVNFRTKASTHRALWFMRWIPCVPRVRKRRELCQGEEGRREQMASKRESTDLLTVWRFVEMATREAREICERGSHVHAESHSLHPLSSFTNLSTHSHRGLSSFLFRLPQIREAPWIRARFQSPNPNGFILLTCCTSPRIIYTNVMQMRSRSRWWKNAGGWISQPPVSQPGLSGMMIIVCYSIIHHFAAPTRLSTL